MCRVVVCFWLHYVWSSPLIGQTRFTGFSFFYYKDWKVLQSQIGFVLDLFCKVSFDLHVLFTWNDTSKTPQTVVHIMQPNARPYFDSFKTFLFSPLSHHPRFIVTAVWQTVSKHQIHCVLLCDVNNTESSTRPQSVNHDGGTSNSTAAATFITKTCTLRRLLQPTSLPPTVVLSPLFSLSSCSPPLHFCHCNRNHMWIYAYVSTHMHMQVRWQHRSASTYNLPVTVSCAGTEYSHLPMCAVSVPTHDSSHCVLLYEYSLLCQKDCGSVTVS